MKTPLTIIALSIAVICSIVAVSLSHLYFTRSEHTATVLGGHINSLGMRVADLESHKSREFVPVRVWAVVSTSDRPQDDRVRFHLPSEKFPDNYLEVVNAKGGALVRPELRIPANSTIDNIFDIHIEKQFGPVTDAWLSHSQPYQDLSAFDEFRILPPNHENIVRIVARLKPGASVQMHFDIVLLCEK